MTPTVQPNTVVPVNVLKNSRQRRGVKYVNELSFDLHLYGQYVHIKYTIYFIRTLTERRISHTSYGVRPQRRKGGVSTVPAGSRNFSHPVETSDESRKSALTRNSYEYNYWRAPESMRKPNIRTYTRVITNAFGTLTARVYVRATLTV